MSTVAIVPAAGLGSRMGADKALLDLGGRAAFVHIADAVTAAGIDGLIAVRRRGAAPLPATAAQGNVVEVDGSGDMADSLRAALAALPTACERVVVAPVDHALVMADTYTALAAVLARPGIECAVPLHCGRPGHPIALRRTAFAEIAAPGTTLRDVVRRRPERVAAVPTANPWVAADLDRPDDLRAARAALAAQPLAPTELMHRHRSRRAFASTPLADGQLERLVDAARHASTSSFIQAYAVIAVRDAARKDEVARLCAAQPHIRQAPVFLAICADLHKLDVACQARGQRLQTQSLELFLQAAVDAALLGQNLALAAESEGLGACMIGAARNHPVELARLLQLPAACWCLFGLVLGHPTDDPLARGRMPLAGVLHAESYDLAAAAAAIAGADDGMRAWAQRLNAERGGLDGRSVDERKGWADRMAQSWGEGSSYLRARAGLRDELRRLGFGLE